MRKSGLLGELGHGKIERKATRDGYGDGLRQLGQDNPEVVVLTGDLSESTRAHLFQKEFPERFFECGVAEQNMMGIAAGLALSGKIPFVSSYAVFVPGRCWDQLRVSVCYAQANVKIAGAHAGISVGADGATHQALEDIACLRALPNLTIVAPCDYWEARKATISAAAFKGPVYLRFHREPTPVFTTEKTPFEIGRARVLREGTAVTVIACGPLVYEALQAAEALNNGQLTMEKDKKMSNVKCKMTNGRVSVEVINCHTIKPLDAETILKSVRKTGRVVTVEEHQIDGGLGGAVAELLGENYPVPLKRVGMPDHFGESGDPEELLAKWGMNAAGIVKAVSLVFLGRSGRS